MVINIHNKDFFYQEAAETIVDSMFQLFDQGIDQFESYEIWPYNVPISSEEEDYRHFNWTLTVARSDSKNFDYDLFGIAGRDYADEPSIGITIVLPKGKHRKNIEIKRSDLFDVVAHELHHLAQNIDNNSHMRNSAYTGKMAYLLDPYEVEAFHIGVRANSKLSGRTFEEVAQDYIRRTWPEASEQQVEKVYTAWKDTDFPAFQKNKE